VLSVLLEGLGPDPGAVLRHIAPLVRMGYAEIAKALRQGPVVVAVDESIHLWRLFRGLQELGAAVSWGDHLGHPIQTNQDPPQTAGS
jgi:hypothetical protein